MLTEVKKAAWFLWVLIVFVVGMGLAFFAWVGFHQLLDSF